MYNLDGAQQAIHLQVRMLHKSMLHNPMYAKYNTGERAQFHQLTLSITYNCMVSCYVWVKIGYQKDTCLKEIRLQ